MDQKGSELSLKAPHCPPEPGSAPKLLSGTPGVMGSERHSGSDVLYQTVLFRTWLLSSQAVLHRCCLWKGLIPLPAEPLCSSEYLQAGQRSPGGDRVLAVLPGGDTQKNNEIFPIYGLGAPCSGTCSWSERDVLENIPFPCLSHRLRNFLTAQPINKLKEQLPPRYPDNPYYDYTFLEKNKHEISWWKEAGQLHVNPC